MACDDEEPWTYYEIDECPLASDCDPGNFKKWKPWGSTPAEVRAKVVDHLLRSGVHSKSRAAFPTEETFESHATLLVAKCEVHERVWRPGKKQKKEDKRSNEQPISRSELQWMIQNSLDKANSTRLAGAAASSSGAMEATRTLPEKLMAFAESAQRCCRNARSAARLSEAAAGSFNEQAEVFEQASSEIVSFLSSEMHQPSAAAAAAAAFGL